MLGFSDRNRDEAGRTMNSWEGGEIVQAVAYDVPSKHRQLSVPV
jgi:hypothetical protein